MLTSGLSVVAEPSDRGDLTSKAWRWESRLLGPLWGGSWTPSSSHLLADHARPGEGAVMSDPLSPRDTAEWSDLRDERALDSLRASDRDDPDRMKDKLLEGRSDSL